MGRIFYWVYARVFNGTEVSLLSRDKGTEIPSLSRDKGTMGQAQNLTKLGSGWARTVKIWDGTGGDSQKPGRDVGQNGTEQKREF